MCDRCGRTGDKGDRRFSMQLVINDDCIDEYDLCEGCFDMVHVTAANKYVEVVENATKAFRNQ